MRNWQSSHRPKALPAFLLLALAAIGSPDTLRAQQQYRVRLEENFRRDSSGTAVALAKVNGGARVEGVEQRSRWVQITLDGWIWSESVTSTSRDGFHLSVSAQNGENLRVEPSGTVIARLVDGCLLMELERDGDWVRVRRTGWMWGQSLEQVSGVSTNPSPAPSVGDTVLPRLDWGYTAGETVLQSAPDGDTSAVIAAEAMVRVLARTGGWVRVQTEGWIREEDLAPGAPGVLVGVSGAEVRSRPADFEGKTVQWTVQFIAVQRADEVRYDIPSGQRYLLVRGPHPETGFAYLTVTDDQLDRVERLAPLTDLVIVAQVRTGRSRYLGNPVLHLIDFAVREQ